MAKLKNPNETPPGGFEFKEHRTGLMVKGNNIFELETNVSTHRQYRGIGPTDKQTIRAEVMRQICKRLGSAHCIPESKYDPWKPVEDLTLSIGLSQVMAASRAMLEWISSGFGMASMEETQARREICAVCPLNRHAHGCKCDMLYKMINSAVPKERQFADLNICGACGCSLKAKCSAPANVIIASEQGKNTVYANECWVPALLSNGK